jgi:hypothetical protein
MENKMKKLLLIATLLVAESQIEAENLTLKMGETSPLTLPKNILSLDANGSKIATITANGQYSRITGKQPGVGTITARMKNPKTSKFLSRTMKFNIVPKKTTKVKGRDLSLKVNRKLKLSGGKNIEWSLDANGSGIAMLTSDRLDSELHALKAGTGILQQIDTDPKSPHYGTMFEIPLTVK